MSNIKLTDEQKIEKKVEDTLKEIQEALKKIAKKYPLLTEDDKGFVRARVDYLNEKQKVVFAPLFEKPKKAEKN